jgi:hypothetical protein
MYDGVPEVWSVELADAECPFPSTFCYWYDASDSQWRSGARDLPPGDDPGGARETLKPYLLDENSALWWLQRFYDLTPSATRVLTRLLNGAPVVSTTIRAFKSRPAEDLKVALREIGWPFSGI